MIVYKGRPDSLRQFISAYLDTGAIARVCIALEELIEDVSLPPTFIVAQAPKDSGISEILNMVFKAFPNEAYYGYIPEGVIPKTNFWDASLGHACRPDKIIVDKFCFMGGDLVRKLGWFAAPVLKDSYIENVWDIVGEILKVKTPTDIKMISVEEPQADTSVDKIAFESFRRFELPAMLEKLL